MSDEAPVPSDAPKPNWDLARILYCAGESHSPIVEKTGCTLASLRKRILRQNWVALKSQATAVAPVGTVAVSDLESTSRSVRQLAAAEVERGLQTLSKIPVPANFKGAKQHSSIFEGPGRRGGRNVFMEGPTGAHLHH